MILMSAFSIIIVLNIIGFRNQFSRKTAVLSNVIYKVKCPCVRPSPERLTNR